MIRKEHADDDPVKTRKLGHDLKSWFVQEAAAREDRAACPEYDKKAVLPRRDGTPEPRAPQARRPAETRRLRGS